MLVFVLLFMLLTNVCSQVYGDTYCFSMIVSQNDNSNIRFHCCCNATNVMYASAMISNDCAGNIRTRVAKYPYDCYADVANKVSSLAKLMDCDSIAIESASDLAGFRQGEIAINVKMQYYSGDDLFNPSLLRKTVTNCFSSLSCVGAMALEAYDIFIAEHGKSCKSVCEVLVENPGANMLVSYNDIVYSPLAVEYAHVWCYGVLRADDDERFNGEASYSLSNPAIFDYDGMGICRPRVICNRFLDRNHRNAEGVVVVDGWVSLVCLGESEGRGNPFPNVASTVYLNDCGVHDRDIPNVLTQWEVCKTVECRYTSPCKEFKLSVVKDGKTVFKLCYCSGNVRGARYNYSDGDVPTLIHPYDFSLWNCGDKQRLKLWDALQQFEKVLSTEQALDTNVESSLVAAHKYTDLEEFVISTEDGKFAAVESFFEVLDSLKD